MLDFRVEKLKLVSLGRFDVLEIDRDRADKLWLLFLVLVPDLHSERFR